MTLSIECITICKEEVSFKCLGSVVTVCMYLMMHLFYLFVCLFVFYLFVCLSEHHTSKPVLPHVQTIRETHSKFSSPFWSSISFPTKWVSDLENPAQVSY